MNRFKYSLSCVQTYFQMFMEINFSFDSRIGLVISCYALYRFICMGTVYLNTENAYLFYTASTKNYYIICSIVNSIIYV